MSDNAELWSFSDVHSQYVTVTAWLKNHNITFDQNEPLENLIQLYRDIECGKI